MAYERVKALVGGTPLEASFRRIYRYLATGSDRPLIAEWDLREARDGAYVRSLLRSRLKPDSCCIDIGAHQGVFLAQFLEFAPHGKHYAFEPIPGLAQGLRTRFPDVEVHDCALSDHAGTAAFEYVPALAGWSGLRAQPYPVKVERQPLQVALRRLDDIIPADRVPAFIKIDVEGAELEVIGGARNLISRCRPVIYFECGKIHHTHYETTPEQVFDLLASCGMEVALLDQTPLARPDFVEVYEASHRSGYDRAAWSNYLALPAQ